MAISRFDRRRGFKFNPLSMEELSYAPMLLRQQEDQLNERIIADADSLAGLFNTGDSTIENSATGWNQQLDELAGLLTKEGYNSSAADQYNNLRRTYSQKIVPMKQYIEQRNLRNQDIQKYKADANNIMIGADTPMSYDDWSKNGNKFSDYSVENRSNLYNKGREVGAKFATALSNPEITATKAGENLVGYLQAKYGETRWNSPEAIAQEVDDANSPLQKVIHGYLSGVTSHGNNADVRNAFIEGIKSTGWGTDKTGLIADKDWEYQKQLNLIAERATTSNKKSNGMAIRPMSNEYTAGRKKVDGATDLPSNSYTELKHKLESGGYTPEERNIALFVKNSIEDKVMNDPQIKAKYDKIQTEKPTYAKYAQDATDRIKEAFRNIGVPAAELDFGAWDGETSEEQYESLMNNVHRLMNKYTGQLDNDILGAKYELDKSDKEYFDHKSKWDKKLDDLTSPIANSLMTNMDAEVIQFEDPKKPIRLITDYLYANPEDVGVNMISNTGFKKNQLKSDDIAATLNEFAGDIKTVFRTRGTTKDKITFTAVGSDNKSITFTVPNSGMDFFKRMGIVNDDMSILSEFVEGTYQSALRKSDGNKLMLSDIVPESVKDFKNFKGSTIQKIDGAYYVVDANGEPKSIESGSSKLAYPSLSELINELYTKMGFLSSEEDFYRDMMSKASTPKQNQEYWMQSIMNANN